jgi:hypothetical protein
LPHLAQRVAKVLSEGVHGGILCSACTQDKRDLFREAKR